MRVESQLLNTLTACVIVVCAVGLVRAMHDCTRVAVFNPVNDITVFPTRDTIKSSSQGELNLRPCRAFWIWH